jgi:hypothetical protein
MLVFRSGRVHYFGLEKGGTSMMCLNRLFLGVLMVALAGSAWARKPFISKQDQMAAVGQLQAKVGAVHKDRIVAGVAQVARLWQEQDGDAIQFIHFCNRHFMVGEDLDGLFERWQRKTEAMDGHLNEIRLTLRLEAVEDTGAPLPVDTLFAKLDLGAHLSEDLFKTKLAFVSLLNFPLPTPDTLINKSGKWTRRQWAEARLAQKVSRRIPAGVNQKITEADAEAGDYISHYNVCLDHVVGQDGKPMFRKGVRLIAHWGLRDEIKAQYKDPENLSRQKMIQTIMERIVNQEIPEVVVKKCAVLWDPVANTVNGEKVKPEPDTRYAHLLATFRARKLLDPYFPAQLNTHVKRRFLLHREMPKADVEALLKNLLKAKVSGQIANLIRQRLGRNLQPFDIWYAGFKPETSLDERSLDRIVGERYPTLKSFDDDIPTMLGSLGFDKETAEFLGRHIELDAARGSGHAAGPAMRGAPAHLRTRFPKTGMDYKGFNIAIHELGHNVEQVFSLYKVDHTLLEGVPNTAFTESFAFVFQARDLKILGVAKPDPLAAVLKALHDFWQAREIAGVALLDIRVWDWMYANPNADAATLHNAVVRMAKDVWNQYYAKVFGVKDSPLLAIYSHMIAYAMYLPDYPMGYMIASQVENYFQTHPLAKEMERMCAQGKLTPDAWMQSAIGTTVSSTPIITAARKAIKKIRK